MTEETKKKKKNDVPTFIVGMGGSAGGLEAFEEFLKHMPPDSGMGFVIVAHLDPAPAHKGIMVEILQRATQMSVTQAVNGQKVKPNCVYVIPPNRDISILHGTLHLLEPSAPRGMRMPIDFFFRQLAKDQAEKSIGVILSGMGTDGTLGLKAIKENLGMTMVQDPRTAKYDGMPRSAIDTNMVDFIAPARDLTNKLTTYGRHAAVVPAAASTTSDSRANSALQKIFALLREHTGHDFSYYKRNTLFRRIERRMSLHQIRKLPQYVRYMQENPPEVDLLFQEMLIGVTNFFRDPEAFEMLETKALEHLLRHRNRSNPLRVWCAGCSTGEEAYSIAIVLREGIEKAKFKPNVKVQLFATDIDKNAVEKARLGIYPANIAADVSPERLSRFFTKDDGGFRIRKDIREMVVFAPQNIIMDPPFTKLDLLCCRNLLIYLNADLQKKLIPLFHYALNPDGVLFLGSSESVGSFNELFEPLDNKWKIFQRKEIKPTQRGIVELPSTLVTQRAHRPEPVQRPHREGEVPEAAQKILLGEFAPPAVLIDDRGDIQFINGRTGKFLEPAAGKSNMNIFAMAREGLRLDLTAAVRKAARSKMPVRLKDLRVKTNGGYSNVHLNVKPCMEPESVRGLLLVTFEETKPLSPAELRRMRKTDGKGSVHKELERELKYTKDTLQTTIEEMETSQEELKSTNEELQSTNEELQSSNEELTTSKEEMQSLNEELVTVNTELESKVEALSRTNNDMKNLLNSIDMATIFLDNNLKVKRFTQQTTKLINLIPTDIGRPITDIVSNLKYKNFIQDVQEVMQSLVFKEIEVENNEGKWYQMRIMPYRTLDNVIDGTAITFSDISRLKALEATMRDREAASARQEYLQSSLLSITQEPLLLLDDELRIVMGSVPFCKEFNVDIERAKGEKLFKINGGEWDFPAIRKLLQDVLPIKRQVSDYVVEHEFKSAGSKKLAISARLAGDKDSFGVVMSIRNAGGRMK